MAGPVFANVLLADEINRASSKTQSALLEAMEERSISVEGMPRALPTPFFVIATQNPRSQIGTFALPESQLDRFLMRLSIGLPSAATERDLLAGNNPRAALNLLKSVCTKDDLLAAQAAAAKVLLAPALLDYVQLLIAATRTHAGLLDGVSPRGALALAAATRAHAWLSDKDYATPADVQAVFVAICAHRVKTKNSGAANDDGSVSMMQEILRNTSLA